MRRREFIALVGGAAAAWPVAVWGQQSERMRRIGILHGGNSNDQQVAITLHAFEGTLYDLGWVPGRNVIIERRFSGSNTDSMKALAKELVKLKCDIVVGHTTPVVAALKKETSTLPIVFVTVSDPVGSGFVKSLARPGGNITGFINLEDSLAGKWIEILKEIAPQIGRAALMFNPDTAPHWKYYLRVFENVGRSFGIETVVARVSAGIDIQRFITSFAQSSNSGLVVMPDIFSSRRDILELIISLADRLRLPTVYPFGFMTKAGGLISYGIDGVDQWRRAPTYVDRILKGANPAELPVQLPVKFELLINLKTAKALGLEVPPMLLARADEVIE